MSLVISYNELQKAVGRYLGCGRNVYGPDNGTVEWADIEDCIKSGLRQFYSPPIAAGMQQLHHWSFLEPTATLSLVSGRQDYDMPVDFGGIKGNMTYEPSEANYPIVVVGETQIRKLRQNRGDETDNPKFVGIRPKSIDGSVSQRFEAVFWPKPNAANNISYRYYVIPAMITNDLPYPYGGAVHSETILESCLAIAEQRLNDSKGLHWDKFMERLAASIQYDLKTSCPDYFGYNGDNSDSSTHIDRTDEVTYNGNSID